LADEEAEQASELQSARPRSTFKRGFANRLSLTIHYDPESPILRITHDSPAWRHVWALTWSEKVLPIELLIQTAILRLLEFFF
jgi:hypothetical protein